VTRIQELQEICKPVIDYIKQHRDEISSVTISEDQITADKDVMVIITPWQQE